MSAENANTSRRGFLKASTGLAAGATLLGTLAVPRNVHAGASEELKIGLVGCGRRGTSAAQNALNASPDNVLIAIADTFADNADTSLRELKRDEKTKDRVQVQSDHKFTGFDAYKQLIDSDVDVVILATPPHFRPQHLAYAVEKGKHTFVEKPVAVDAPGVRDVIATCAKAKEKNLAVVSGLCWRYHPAVQETVKRIVQDKAIGDIVAIQSTYNGGTLWHRGDDPKWSRMEYQVRNWLYFHWLSGDHICEQAVHSLDKTAWLQGDISPTQAFGLGGRQRRLRPSTATSTITTQFSTNIPPACVSFSLVDSKVIRAHSLMRLCSAPKGVRTCCSIASKVKTPGRMPGQIGKIWPRCTTWNMWRCSTAFAMASPSTTGIT